MFKILFLSFLFSVFLFGIDVKSFFTYTFDRSDKYDLQEARKLYFYKKCHTCHGDSGEKKLVGSRVLKDMSPEDIKAALVGYASGFLSGNSQMVFYAKSLSYEEMNKIIAYLKGENFAANLEVKDFLEQEPPKKTKHGTFLR